MVLMWALGGSQDEVAAGAAAASTPRAVAPAPSTPASAASALAPAASAPDGSSMRGAMGDAQSVAALIEETDIYCGVWRGHIEAQGKVGAKETR